MANDKQQGTKVESKILAPAHNDKVESRNKDPRTVHYPASVEFVAEKKVDGHDLKLILLENDAGIAGNKVAVLQIDGVQFEATKYRSNALEEIDTPHQHAGADDSLVSNVIGTVTSDATYKRATLAPAMINAVEKAMGITLNEYGDVAQDHNKKVTDQDFRQIRDAFQKIDHGETNANNLHLNGQASQGQGQGGGRG
jgi:hypothetical protein